MGTPPPHLWQIQRQNCLRTMGGHLKNMWRAISSWANFCQKHDVANFGFPRSIWSWGNQASVSVSNCKKMWKWEASVQMGESSTVWVWSRVWAQNLRHTLAGISITGSDSVKSTEEMPREEAELYTDLNHIWTPGSNRKMCFPCYSAWKCCFNWFNVIMCVLSCACLKSIPCLHIFSKLYIPSTHFSL